MKRETGAFTLVELIVVITILAILGTIAFISLQWYSRDARDSVRISDVSNLTSSLDLFAIKTGSYPFPSWWVAITYSWSEVWTQWTIWETVITNLRNINTLPLDPSFSSEYAYSVTESNKEFQIGTILEGNSASSLNLSHNTYAAESSYFAYVKWNYNWVSIKTSTWNLTYIFAVPSILSSDLSEPDIIKILEKKSLVFHGYKNLPSNLSGNNVTLTGSFNIGWVWYSPIIYAGLLSNLSSTWSLENFAINLQNAYSGTQLTSNPNYSQILSMDSWNIHEVNLITGTIINHLWWKINIGILSSSTWWGWGWSIPASGWMLLDTACDIPDITIWSQTWAWCNSTIWTGFEWWESGFLAWCSDYNWGTSLSCAIWDPLMASDAKANTWFTPSNPGDDTEVDNIWGKVYTFTDKNTACISWYHVPNESDWETLFTTLNGGTNCENWGFGWLCPGLWWMGHSWQTNTNNVIEALQIPLAWIRKDNTWYDNRWEYATFWSDFQSWSFKYLRQFGWNNSWINRTGFNTTDIAYSVRCIKD